MLAAPTMPHATIRDAETIVDDCPGHGAATSGTAAMAAGISTSSSVQGPTCCSTEALPARSTPSAPMLAVEYAGANRTTAPATATQATAAF
ncbi:hypothetical protein ASD19_04890 [Microbacterium sp. Root53]|nr:hypothetical protein ASD19_04890 [Microbacterium sp. Root53]